MILITHSVVRETSSSVVDTAIGITWPIVVTLYPEFMVLRVKGSHHGFSLSYELALQLAIVHGDRTAKKEERRRARKGLT